MDGRLSHASWVFLELVLVPSKAAAACAIHKARSCEQFIRALRHMKFTSLKKQTVHCGSTKISTRQDI
jgi:hypothetical protein